VPRAGCRRSRRGSAPRRAARQLLRERMWPSRAPGLSHAERLGDEVRAPGQRFDGCFFRGIDEIIGRERRDRSSASSREQLEPVDLRHHGCRGAAVGALVFELPSSPSPPGAVTTSYPFLLEDPGQRPHQRLIRRGDEDLGHGLWLSGLQLEQARSTLRATTSTWGTG